MRLHLARAGWHAVLKKISRILNYTKLIVLVVFTAVTGTLTEAAPEGTSDKFYPPLQISGKVTDEAGKPIEGVSVSYVGSALGTTTNADGQFIISIPKAGMLSFSHVGFTTQVISVNEALNIDIKLRLLDASMNRVVVIGYGAVRKKDITGAVSVVEEKDFNKGVAFSALELIQGKVAGLNITFEGGDVTVAPTIRIRGTSSLVGSSEPFVVIDGVPGMFLNAVAPQDIESITVLKDAAASAIYGSRSASGVILITTKKGKDRQPEIRFSNYLAAEKASGKPDVLTADEWRQYTRENSLDVTGLDLAANTNWFDEIMRTGLSNNHSVSLSGSTEKTNYSASMNYLKRLGIMKDNQVKKLNGLFSASHNALNDRLNISLTGGIVHIDFSPAYPFNLLLAYNMLPVYPVKNNDGTWFEKSDHWGVGNPVHNIESNRYHNEMAKLYANGSVKLKPMKGLTLGTNFLKQRLNLATGFYESIGSQAGRLYHGHAVRWDQVLDRDLMELTGEYERQFHNHNFRMFGGYSYEENKFEYFSGSTLNFITDRFDYNNLRAGGAVEPNEINSYQHLIKYISFFGRLNYNFKSKYNIDATLRRDGSSKFGANNKWGMFPSVSAAWFVSDEKFMSTVNFVTTLKLRAGYGVVGNQEGIEPYKSMALYRSGDPYLDNGQWKNTFTFKQNANPDLKWEQTSTLNLGVDFGIISGKVSGAVDYYIKKTSDVLFEYNVPVPPNILPTTLANVGDISNKGIEITINTDNIRTESFAWTSSITFASNKNVLVRLSNDVYQTERILTGYPYMEPTHILEEGKEFGTFYGLQSRGIDANGKYIFVDQNKDGEINELDRTYLGHAWPRIIYGVYNTFSYKRLKLSFLLRGTQGNDVLNTARLDFANLNMLPAYNVLKEALTSALRDGPKYSSYYLEDGSFLRLDNATLSYDINTKKLRGIKNANVYLTVQNLFVITPFKGMDPEVSMNGFFGFAPGILDVVMIPRPRSFLFGIDISF